MIEFPEQYKQPFEDKLCTLLDLSQEMMSFVSECSESNDGKIIGEKENIRIEITKGKKMNDDDVFGIITHAESGKQEIVILKSKAMELCMKRDGMSLEEFEEHWDYNIEGAKGRYSYSVVDDTLTSEMIADYIDNDEDNEIINPPCREE